MIGNDWDIVLHDVMEDEQFKILMNKVNLEYEINLVCPLKEDLFNAYKMTPYKDVRVVIIGQDPYHGAGEAHGLSFSVLPGVKFPPSLRNIFIELKEDLGINTPLFGDLSKWCQNGVMLLNNSLTVIQDNPNSHAHLGWNYFTDATIRKLNEKDTPIVFILWGNFAQTKKEFITNPIHFIIESPHPSPFSARKGFFGSKPFSRTNTFFKDKGLEEVNWEL